MSKYKCPKCEESRDRVNKVTKKVPCKVLRYIPISLRFQELSRCKSIAHIMDYHANNKSEHGVLLIPMDGYIFMKIEEI